MASDKILIVNDIANGVNNTAKRQVVTEEQDSFITNQEGGESLQEVNQTSELLADYVEKHEGACGLRETLPATSEMRVSCADGRAICPRDADPEHLDRPAPRRNAIGDWLAENEQTIVFMMATGQLSLSIVDVVVLSARVKRCSEGNAFCTGLVSMAVLVAASAVANLVLLKKFPQTKRYGPLSSWIPLMLLLACSTVVSWRLMGARDIVLLLGLGFASPMVALIAGLIMSRLLNRFAERMALFGTAIYIFWSVMTMTFYIKHGEVTVFATLTFFICTIPAMFFGMFVLAAFVMRLHDGPTNGVNNTMYFIVELSYVCMILLQNAFLLYDELMYDQ